MTSGNDTTTVQTRLKGISVRTVRYANGTPRRTQTVVVKTTKTALLTNICRVVGRVRSSMAFLTPTSLPVRISQINGIITAAATAPAATVSPRGSDDSSSAASGPASVSAPV